MKKIIFSFIFFLVFISLFGQRETNIWYFGNQCGIDFNSGSPVVLTNGKLNTDEGCASICDTNGNLLFYSDGITVWDKNHNQMPNGHSLGGGVSSTQSSIIIPKPGSDNLFYLFTTAQEVSPNLDLKYSIIDLSLNGGYGDLTLKNISLVSQAPEKLTAVRNSTNTGFWIVVHTNANNSFYAYELTAAGLNTVPVISTLGKSFVVNGDNTGQMKFSPNGTKLAITGWITGFIELFDFNSATGVISNNKLLNIPFSRPYGLEFSPSGKYLYSASLSPKRIFQWDISLPTSVSIDASIRMILNTAAYEPGQLQLGPDGKIYVSLLSSSYLSVINSPDLQGAACNFVENAIYLNGKRCRLGLPAYIQSNFIPPINLPIKLIDFVANPIGNKVELNWSTASEINNSFFTILKSKDGDSWNEVCKIEGSVNSTSIKTYSAIDENPYTGSSYYRLMQTDFDGKFTYSKPVKINFIGSDKINVYPNPAVNYLMVEANEISEFSIKLINFSGKEFKLSSTINFDHFRLDTSSLPRGIYMLFVEHDNNIIKEEKVIIQ